MANASRIPDDVIADIKARNDIVSVVEQYVNLNKRSGKNYFGLCPFHHEDTPSFSVSPSKQIFYCFGCHKGGDVLRFIMDIEHLSYLEALRLLAARAQIDLPTIDDAAYEKKRSQRQLLTEINLQTARYYYKNLLSPAGQPARDYLKQRGISAQTLQRFGLGYAGAGWDDLYQYLLKQSFTPAELAESGLFRQNKYARTIDLFRERLIFPIMSGVGRNRVIAFGGRVLDHSLPKYINSPETVLYVKGQHLYGLNLARQSKSHDLILVEGYMDCISLHQAGIDNAVAALGTALTEQQIRLLHQHTSDLIISFDADTAGQTATLRSLDLLEKEGLSVRVLKVPGSKDPDEYIRQNGAERFRALADQALPLLDYKFSVALSLAQKNGSTDLTIYQDQLCQILERINNSILFEIYLKKAAELLGISLDTIRAELQHRQREHRGGKSSELATKQAKPVNGRVAADGSGQDPQTESRVKVHMSQDEAYFLTILATEPDIWPDLALRPQPEDFLLAADRAQAPQPYAWLGEVLAQAAKGELGVSALLAPTSQFELNGTALNDVLTALMMRLPEQASRAQAKAEADRYYKQVRIDALSRTQHQLREQLRHSEKQQQPELEQKLRQDYQATQRQLYELRFNGRKA
ncbi:MAG: DNA primase [Oscillospiraceae bacterium]|nr:DNA primase [Oscillospiraceae bacterium]MDD4367960.1 DNA primase [Oscillospiraceae bacterium]